VQPKLTHECVLELLNLSSTVNEWKPLPSAGVSIMGLMAPPWGRDLH